MRDFLEKNRDIIWYLMCVIAVALGVFVDVAYGFIVVLLIGVYCYIVLDDITSNLETFDRFGATFVGFLLHLFCYILIIVFVSFIVAPLSPRVLAKFDFKTAIGDAMLPFAKTSLR